MATRTTLHSAHIDIGAAQLYAHPATVTGFEVFKEDHGILTCWVHLDLATGGSQSFGGYGLDEYIKDKDAPPDQGVAYVSDRRVSMYLAWWIQGLTTVLGSLPPKNGLKVIALKESDQWNELIYGIASFDGSRYFIPKWLPTNLESLANGD